jgi:hypothetical protein
MSANERISLSGPGKCRVNWFLKVQVLQPGLFRICKLAICNLNSKLVGPVAGQLRRVAVKAAQQLLGNRAVPDVVEIEVFTIKDHRQPIASLFNIFVMQRLVEIADKMDNELGGLVAPPEGQLGLD